MDFLHSPYETKYKWISFPHGMCMRTPERNSNHHSITCVTLTLPHSSGSTITPSNNGQCFQHARGSQTDMRARAHFFQNSHQPCTCESPTSSHDVCVHISTGTEYPPVRPFPHGLHPSTGVLALLLYCNPTIRQDTSKLMPQPSSPIQPDCTRTIRTHTPPLSSM